MSFKPLDVRVISGLGNLGGDPPNGAAEMQNNLREQANSPRMLIWGLISAASAGVSGFHGYKRNNSVGWGIAWFILGGMFPVITPTVAFAQGFGKRKGR
jgi:hypothetical protein